MKLCWRYWGVILVLGVSGVEAWQEVSWIGPVIAGLDTTFNCTSFCGKKCTYTWSLLGRNYTGNTLIWTPDGRDSKVELLCTVVRITKGTVFSTSTSIVEIKNFISVQPSRPYTIPSLNQSLDLICKDDSGSDLLSDPQLVHWYKDGQKMQLDKTNGSLHFDSLLPSDGGLYRCGTSVSQEKRVYSRDYLLSFDPWNVSISGPDVVFLGKLSIFNCVVSCNINVDCTVRWLFNGGGGFPVGLYFSSYETELKWTPSKAGTFQNFTCIAENAVAGRSVGATKMVEVKDTPLSGSESAQLNRLLFMISILIVLLDSSRV